MVLAGQALTLLFLVLSPPGMVIVAIIQWISSPGQYRETFLPGISCFKADSEEIKAIQEMLEEYKEIYKVH